MIQELESRLIEEKGPFEEYILNRNTDNFFKTIYNNLSILSQDERKISFLYENEKNGAFESATLYVIKPEAQYNKIIKNIIPKPAYPASSNGKSETLNILENLYENSAFPGENVNVAYKGLSKKGAITKLKSWGILNNSCRLLCSVIKVNDSENKILEDIYNKNIQERLARNTPNINS